MLVPGILNLTQHSNIVHSTAAAEVSFFIETLLVMFLYNGMRLT